MLYSNSFNLEDRLKLLILNLEKGASMYSSIEGLKGYYESIPLEITSLIHLLDEVSPVIECNTDLFCSNAIFQIDYDHLRTSFEKHLEKLKSNPLVTNEITETLQKLINRIDKIIELINDPADEKVLLFYQTICNEFETTRRKKVAQYYHVNIMAILPNNPDMRRKTLEHYQSKYLQKLNENKVFEYKKQYLSDNVFDEICHDGALVPENIAPIIFKHRKNIGDKETVLEFLRLFMIYQEIQTDLNKVNKTVLSTPVDDNMRNWFEGLGKKLLLVVKQEYRDDFPALISSLCQQPDLANALKRKTLKVEYNLKLAYNLFGLMMRKNLFLDNVTMRSVDNLISAQRQDQYIKAGKYNNEGKYNELNPALRQKASETIDSWLKSQAKS